ncbi:AAA family ATPase [Gordonia amicalis]|uniref:AAA family ATPase n=1 Tax=Gordonia amicalis TaxID=89053 RepID=UPI0029552132|nr:AAA family ATPase [Gordonia amicalis]MDV7102048.1 AAA family ATPase [Gordonia amicalis]
MSPDTKITVYYGPLSWFDEIVGEAEDEGLLEAAFALDEKRREFRLAKDDDEDDEVEIDRPERLIAKSGDYASLNEHVISNFSGLIRTLDPEQLHLHNPPEQVRIHLQRVFSGSFNDPILYDYPTVTKDTLKSFYDDFGSHLIGQEGVRGDLLAALYPLTRPGRKTPVVVMFYGPSGVGKTETARFVNGLLDGELLRKQFSMFHSENFASYLFGGRHSEASFARDLLDRESGVVLIDEFDKAAEVFHSAFYQFFDGGVFEDKNYRVDIGPALIICTSNYRSEKEISSALGDALFSRFDALIEFSQPSQEQVISIIDRLVDQRVAALGEDEKADLDIDQVKRYLHPISKNASNVRKLGKLADQIISTILVERLIGL